ncbi:MAG TPA: DNA polymerase III subunit [Vicinamibacterales bacterium]|nr:DNA polymerase III subunit [Vicinamibacterales bacterium]
MPFRDLAGHRRTFLLLSRSIALGSLPPSLVFTGPEGVGKRRAALALAQTLNCPAPKRDVAIDPGVVLPIDACGACPSCRRLARLVHPDLLVVEPDEETGNTRIEEVRPLLERIAYRPFEAHWRVVVIDRAEALVSAAQNALLKTLEEPPSSTVFVLVASRPDALLPTVRSRCPPIRFGPLAIADVARVLERDHNIPAREAQGLAAVSGGSVGAALQTGAASLANARAAASRLLAELARPRDVHARLAAAGAIVGKTSKGYGAGEREALTIHLRAVHALLRDLGVMSARGSAPEVANVDLEPALAKLASAFDGPRLVAAFAAVDQALAALQGNASPKIVADWVVMHI